MTFKPHDAVGEPARIFYKASSQERQTLRGKPETTVYARKGKEKLATKYLTQAGHCLVTTGTGRIMSNRITAVYSETASLGVAFCPVLTETREEAKALTVWLNSVFTKLCLFNLRSGVSLENPKWSHTQLRKLLLPNPDRCHHGILLRCFEDVKDDTIGRMDQYLACPVREKIDRASAAATNIEWSRADSWRRALATEPTILGG